MFMCAVPLRLRRDLLLLLALKESFSLEGNLLYEAIHTNTTICAGESVRGQGMVCTTSIVACTFGREITYENRACIGYLFCDRISFLTTDNQVWSVWARFPCTFYILVTHLTYPWYIIVRKSTHIIPRLGHYWLCTPRTIISELSGFGAAYSPLFVTQSSVAALLSSLAEPN